MRQLPHAVPSTAATHQFLRSFILAIVTLIFSASATAQWRLDGDVRLGATNIDNDEPWGYNSGYGLAYYYFDAFSWGADVNIGREFNRGWGVYSGVMYDMMRFEGRDKTLCSGGGSSMRHPTSMHVFSYVTIPVKVEYRFVKDIIRPYVGFGVGLMCGEHKNYTEELHSWPIYTFHHNTVMPKTMFGLNLEYKRFIVGFSRSMDVKKFWWEDTTRNTWRMAQTTAKIGFRIF